jgi:hypothetical protein
MCGEIIPPIANGILLELDSWEGLCNRGKERKGESVPPIARLHGSNSPKFRGCNVA